MRISLPAELRSAEGVHITAQSSTTTEEADIFVTVALAIVLIRSTLRNATVIFFLYHVLFDVSFFADIDECSEMTHNCPQLCDNMNGTYRCSCLSGFKFANQECRVTEGDTTLIFSTGGEIHGLSMKDQRGRDLVLGEDRIRDLDYDPTTQIVYWTDSRQKRIKRSLIPGGSMNRDAEIGAPQELNLKGS